MIQYDVYKSPFSKEEEPDHYHARAVSKGVITYEYPLLSREGSRNSSIYFPRPGSFHTPHTRQIPSDDIGEADDPRFITR